MQVTSKVRDPLVELKPTEDGQHKEVSYSDITHDICRQVEGKPTKIWLAAFGISFIVLVIGAKYLWETWYYGIGMWGLNKTIGWAWDITNFVWWVGIGHAGTLISAILLLFRQKWRNSINRAAEAMTIFAVLCAGLFILSHMGRPWLAYWPLPLGNTFGTLWPNFNSALVWDVFAISTYLTVSLVFWFVGLVPDLATIRDRATNPISKFIYGTLAHGWNGSAKDWSRFESVSLILAGLSTPLVLSVHSVVSMDFATSLIPGWHTTIFPPYFVAGAIYSGFAMVLTLMLIARVTFKLQHYITMDHIDSMNKITLLTGTMVGVAYMIEFFVAWYSQVPYESYAFLNRFTGPYWWAEWALMICNVISPQFLWFKAIRRNIIATFLLSLVFNIGMWFERFVIIVISIHRDFLPSSWAYFTPTSHDIGVYVFTFGLFFTLFFLFAKFLPIINMFEVKMILKSSKAKKDDKTKSETTA